MQPAAATSSRVRHRRALSALLMVALLAVLAVLAIMPDQSFATTAATNKGKLVADLADFFTPAQESQLTQQAATLGDQYQMDIIIVTTRDTGGKSARAYADDYFDNNGYGVGPDKNGILFLIDYANREAYISTSGSGIRYLTDQRISQILDAVIAGGLKSGDNFGAAQVFLSQTTTFLQAGIPSGQYNQAERVLSITLLDVLLGLAGAAAVGLTVFGSTRYSYKGHPRPAIFEFRGNSIVSLGITADNLVNTFVTTRHVPPPPPAGGGFSGRSTTHTSSGGGTHGGGGRGF